MDIQWVAELWACLYLMLLGEGAGRGLIDKAKLPGVKGNDAVRWQVCAESIPSPVYDLLRTVQSSKK